MNDDATTINDNGFTTLGDAVAPVVHRCTGFGPKTEAAIKRFEEGCAAKRAALPAREIGRDFTDRELDIVMERVGRTLGL